MPELPEVQTVRDGLAPVMEGYVFNKVTLNRPDLRFPFAERFSERLTGAKIDSLTRRAKFLMLKLSTGETLLMHLGMSGRFTVHMKEASNEKHDHVIFEMSSGAQIIYNDARRFGFMELFAKDEPIERLSHLGPEPMGNNFNAPILRENLKGKSTKIKVALLDQRVVSGLGNIYVCEALYRSGLSPLKAAGQITLAQAELLTRHIKDVLEQAVKAGGSTLRDFANAQGDLGYFQHSFDVYGREGEPCKSCNTPIARLAQGGRSTFYCPKCQNLKNKPKRAK